MQTGKGTNCIAHRGFSGEYPENTMLAFQKAVEAGCDGIELDVHLTKDGEIVVIHDETVDRTTDGRGAVKDYTLSELRRLDASGRFTGLFGVQHIPTLREYFDYIRSFSIFTNIELKNSEYYYEGLEEKTITLIREYHLEDRILFSSFNNASVLFCRKLAPEIPGGFLCTDPIQNCGAYALSCGAAYIHPEYSRISEAEIDDCHERGIGINAWTVNEPNHMLWLIRKKISGIITNYPNLCTTLLHSSSVKNADSTYIHSPRQKFTL